MALAAETVRQKPKVGHIGATVDQGTVDRLDEMAAQSGLTRASLIRLAIRQFSLDPAVLEAARSLREARRAV